MNTTVDLISNDPVQNLPRQFISFIEQFRIEDAFIYKSQLTRAIHTNTPTFVIHLTHLSAYSPDLYNHLLATPIQAIASFETILASTHNFTFTLHFISNAQFTSLRCINTNILNKLIHIKGITVSASVPTIRPKTIHLVCKKCLASKKAVDYMPRTCEATCGLDPFYVDCEKSEVVDEQYVKVQEMFEDIPVGEMPRHFVCVMERSLVDCVVPGEKVKITGIVQMRGSFGGNISVRVIGIEKEKRNRGFHFSDEEKEAFREFARNHHKIKIDHNENNYNEDNEDIYKNDANNKNSYIKSNKDNHKNNNYNNNKESVRDEILSFFAPQIYGHEDMKKAILCMMFGGTRRSKYGVNFRGDINILLLGDPGTAKSQLLKFTNTVSPGVYTSGKGSSAAGLTASVIKNKKGEFYLEGGALVLSDNGICCIDEFDKMDVTDRVAIHEAMEQQTVSINKAGINTVLNTRCAVLAAANPLFGRYDEYKSVGENIDFNSTIMSRFDCIFVVRDVDDRKKDIRLAKHIIDINKQKSDYDKDDSDKSDFNGSDDNVINNTLFCRLGLDRLFSGPLDFLRKYISFARTNIFPSLSEDSKKKLTLFYINTRKKVKDMLNTKKIPITVRQLESLIRLSESLARMELKETVEDEHVNEAIRIFSVSTVDAVNKGHHLEGMTGKETVKEILEVSEKIKNEVPVGMTITYEAVKRCVEGADDNTVGRAVDYLVRTGKIQMRDNGRLILRLFK